ncbi:MAG: hypothetical protein K5750_04015 [Eubacterium sp.]|nr:hypothetical protein [Eubacterium sp.]
MKDINDLTEEELVQIAIQENNAILEQQKEEAKQKEENEKGSKYIQNIYKKLTPEEEMQQLLFIFEGIENPNLSTDLSDNGVSYFLDSSVDRVGYKARCNEILGKLGEKIASAGDFTKMLMNIRKDPKLQELLVLATRYTDSASFKKNFNLYIIAFSGVEFTGLEGQEAEDYIDDTIATIAEDLIERAKKVTGKSEEEINSELDQTHNLLHELDDNNVFAADYDINKAIVGVRSRERLYINFRNKDSLQHEFDREPWSNENGNMENKLHIFLGAVSEQIDDYQYSMLINKISFDQKFKREVSDCVKYLGFDQMYRLRFALQAYFTATLVHNPKNVATAKKLIDDEIRDKKKLAEEIKKTEEEHKKIEEDLKQARKDAIYQVLDEENPFDDINYENEMGNDAGEENEIVGDENEINDNQINDNEINNNQINNNVINNENKVQNNNQINNVVQNDGENVIENNKKDDIEEAIDNANDVDYDDSEYNDEDDIQRDDQLNIDNEQAALNNQLNDQQRAQQIMNQANQQVNQINNAVNVMTGQQLNVAHVNANQPNVGQANAHNQNPPANNRPPRNNNRTDQAIVQNAEAYNNLSVEDKKIYKEYFYGFENYKEGVSSMAIVLDDFCKRLSRTQDNRDANFEDNELVEGSDSYQKMAKALRTVKEQLQNKSSNPSEVIKNFRKLYDAADSYYDSHYGVFGIKGTDRGTDRLKVSKDIKKIALVMMNNYNNLCAGLCVMKDQNGQIFGKKTYNEAEAKYNEVQAVVKYPLNGESGMRIQPYHDQMNTSSYQMKLRAKVHEISKTFSRNYTYIGTVADYQNIKPNMTDLDKAKYFTLKKYMDKAYKPMAEFQAAREVIDKIDGGYIKDEYKKLSKNPEFKECMRKHPQDGLAEWKKIEDQTDELIKIGNRNIERFQADFANFSSTRGDFLTFMEPNALMEDQRNYANDVQSDVADIIFSKIIRNENNRALANKMVTKPEKVEQLCSCIKEAVIEKFGLTLNKDGRGVDMNKFMRVLQNPKITDTAIRNFNNREAAAARQNQQNPQVQNQNDMHM